MRTLIQTLPCAALLGLSTAAHAADHRVGGSFSTDVSTGLVTGIDRVGLHAGLGYTLLGEHQGLFVDARFQQYTWGGWWERFPAVNVGWTMRWGDGDVSAYHSLGAMALITATMDSSLSPVVPAATLEAGADWRHDGWWLRVGGQGFATFPALAAGVGPRVSAGLTF